MIGGNVATNAGGLHCLAHGVTTDHVRGLEVVLTDGSVAWLDELDAPDLRALLVGSEGTLAVVTRRAGVAPPHLRGDRHGRVRLPAARAGRRDGRGDRARRASGLRARVHRRDDARRDLEDVARGASLGGGGRADRRGRDPRREPRRRALDDRGARPRRGRQRRGARRRWPLRPRSGRRAERSGGAFGLLFPDSYTHDFAVPRDRIVEVLRGVAKITEARDVDVVTVAHLGDGNIHPKLVYDGREAGVYDRVIAASNEILALVLANGGTLSGEHGIGLEKLGAMGQQFTPPELDLLRAVRAAFDPRGILNPDKAIPLAGDEARRGVFAHA